MKPHLMFSAREKQRQQQLIKGGNNDLWIAKYPDKIWYNLDLAVYPQLHIPAATGSDWLIIAPIASMRQIQLK